MTLAELKALPVGTVVEVAPRGHRARLVEVDTDMAMLRCVACGSEQVWAEPEDLSLPRPGPEPEPFVAAIERALERGALKLDVRALAAENARLRRRLRRMKCSGPCGRMRARRRP